MRDHPHIPALDIMKEVGRIWQNIKKDELDFLKEKSRRDMDRYWREHEKFITEINTMRAQNKTDKNHSDNFSVGTSLIEATPCLHRSDNIAASKSKD